MLWTIIKRQLMDYMITLRFTITLALCLGMIILSTYVSLQDYRHRLEEYNSYVMEQDGHDVSMNAIYRKPEVLSIFAQGLDKKLGGMIETRGHGASYVTFVGPVPGESTWYGDIIRRFC